MDVKLDTGSTFCVFHRRYADLLDIEVERETLQRMRAATGTFLAYGHDVLISVEGIEWHATVFFAEDEFFPVSVVGRIGFLDRLRIAPRGLRTNSLPQAYDD